jgi:hypothetical protein
MLPKSGAQHNLHCLLPVVGAKTMSDPAIPSASKSWPWPDSLDAVVAAPAHHTVLLEDDRVRVLRTNISPGDVVPLHTHRWGGVAYLESWSHFIRRGEKGEPLYDSRSAPEPSSLPCPQWMPPLPPHTVENIGARPITILIVELKDSGLKDSEHPIAR